MVQIKGTNGGKRERIPFYFKANHTKKEEFH
jgi:hypothetical protein